MLSVSSLTPAILHAEDSLQQKDLLKSIQQLPLLSEQGVGTVESDWLVHPTKMPTSVYRTNHDNELVLTNGLISRTFRILPNAATVALDNHITGQSLVRGVKPEAIVELDGQTFEIGGLKGQPNYAFVLPEWLDTMTSDPAAFQIESISKEFSKSA